MKAILSSILKTILLLCIVSCAGRSDQAFNHYNEKDILLRLINKRLQVAPLVAKSKWNTKALIDDLAREKMILDAVLEHAKKMRINEKFAENFFQAQFEAGKVVQRQMYAQ